MSTPNINCILQALAVVTDQNLPNLPQIVNFDFQNPTLSSGVGTGGRAAFWDPYFQAGTGVTVVPLPAVNIFGLFVQNKSATSNLIINYTPSGGAATPITVGPGGLVIVFDPSEAGQGITAVALSGVGGIVPASVLLVV